MSKLDLTKEEAMIFLHETSYGEEVGEEVASFIDHVSNARYMELWVSGRTKLKAFIEKVD